MLGFVVIVAVAPVLFSARQVQSPDLDASGLAAMIEAGNVLANRDFETTFEVRVFHTPKIEDDGRLDLEDWFTLDEFRYVVVGPKLYIERTSREKPGDADGQRRPPYRQINVWSDGTWSHRVEGESAIDFYSRPGPSDLFSLGFFFNLMEGRFPCYLTTLADSIRTGTLLEQSITDGILTWRFVDAGVSSLGVQRVVRVRLEPTCEVQEHTFEIAYPAAPEASSFQEHVKTRQVYAVRDWESFANFRLPKTVEISTASPTDVETALGPPGLKLHAIFTRKSFRELRPGDIDPALFTFSLPVGTGVYDDRLKLSFRIGERYLSLDGLVYLLDEPLMEQPGERLAELIRAGHPQIPPKRSAAEQSGAGNAELLKPEKPSVLRSPLVLSALIGSGAALLMIAAIRFRRASRGKAA